MAFKTKKLAKGHGFDYYQFCKSQQLSEALDIKFKALRESLISVFRHTFTSKSCYS
jgi:hypothetical protein